MKLLSAIIGVFFITTLSSFAQTETKETKSGTPNVGVTGGRTTTGKDVENKTNTNTQEGAKEVKSQAGNDNGTNENKEIKNDKSEKGKPHKHNKHIKKDKKIKKDKAQQRRHAEERSKGHSYSGHGKGGNKNLAEPEEKKKEELNKSEK